MRLKEFFNDDFKTFSNLDNVRSIPSVVDGFKDSQRKAVYGMIKHGAKEIKVAQLATQAALVTAYDHGEHSMAETIVGLAQDFPGSNNINLFEPLGQFGSILSAESSSHRYIFTRPSIHLKSYIRPEDECILEHRYEDEDKVEPKHFLPILPMWIVNGAIGIGTGHSVKILHRDPSNIKQLIQKLLDGTNARDKTISQLLMPSFTGWKGDVVEIELGKYELHGLIEKVNTTTLRVTELPVGQGIDKFKSTLVALMDKGHVKDFDNNSNEESFDLEIKVPRHIGKKSETELKKMFKLVARHTENVTLWDKDNSLEQFTSVYEALKQFVDHRVDKYESRRLRRIDVETDDLTFLRNKKLFILEWNNLENPGKMDSSDITEHMTRKGVEAGLMDQLMSMRLSSLTLDQINELDKKIARSAKTIERLEKTTPVEMYSADLSTV